MCVLRRFCSESRCRNPVSFDVFASERARYMQRTGEWRTSWRQAPSGDTILQESRHVFLRLPVTSIGDRSASWWCAGLLTDHAGPPGRGERAAVGTLPPPPCALHMPRRLGRFLMPPSPSPGAPVGRSSRIPRFVSRSQEHVITLPGMSPCCLSWVRDHFAGNVSVLSVVGAERVLKMR